MTYAHRRRSISTRLTSFNSSSGVDSKYDVNPIQPLDSSSDDRKRLALHVHYYSTMNGPRGDQLFCHGQSGGGGGGGGGGGSRCALGGTNYSMTVRYPNWKPSQPEASSRHSWYSNWKPSQPEASSRHSYMYPSKSPSVHACSCSFTSHWHCCGPMLT